MQPYEFQVRIGGDRGLGFNEPVYQVVIPVTWLAPPSYIEVSAPELASIGAEFVASVAMSDEAWLEDTDIKWQIEGTTEETIAAVSEIDPLQAFLNSDSNDEFIMAKNTLSIDGAYNLIMILTAREFDDAEIYRSEE